MKLKLEYHILGQLTISSKTGYEIKKYLDTEGRFERARAPLSQIYNTLKRMTENNLVTFEEERREGKPDLKVYSITPEGKDLLIEFLRSPQEMAFRYSESTIWFRIQYAFLIEQAVIIAHIQNELDFRQGQISQFRNRNRTIKSSLLSPSELTYVQAIADEIHNYGSDRMDVYVAHLKEMIVFFENQNGTVYKRR